MTIRNRIQELRTVRAGDLIPNPKNWRRHPQAQRDALATMLERVGMAAAVVARETPEGLVLLDGHLRADIGADAEIPVLVVDLDDAEADEVLATMDPLSVMADADLDSLKSLLDGLREAPPVDFGELYGLLPDDEPFFEPVDEDEQPDMAETPLTKCPECGHEWHQT